MFHVNLPEQVQLTGMHLLVGWAILHFGYAFAQHYIWVFRSHRYMRETNAFYRKRERESGGTRSHDHYRNKRLVFCNKCMAKHLALLLGCGLEYKVLQLFSFAVLWFGKVILGSGFSKPFKIRFFLDPKESVRGIKTRTCEHSTESAFAAR